MHARLSHARRLQLAASLLLAVVIAPAAALAGPCLARIDRAQAELDRQIGAVARAGKTGKESVAATDDNQPSPRSLAQAEAAVGDGTQMEQAVAALARARKADAAGDQAGCEAALAEMDKLIEASRKTLR